MKDVCVCSRQGPLSPENAKAIQRQYTYQTPASCAHSIPRNTQPILVHCQQSNLTTHQQGLEAGVEVLQ